MSFGGGGGGGSDQVAQFKPPDYTLSGWQDYINNMTAITQNPYQPYMGMTIAPINNMQALGMQQMANVAGNLPPDLAAARANNQITAQGGFENPYSTIQTENGYNPWQLAEVAPQIQVNKYRDGSNPYGGFSPEYQTFKQHALDDVTGAYQRGTAAQTDTSFNRAGAFGGGAHVAQVAANEDALARNLARQSSEMDFGQWDRSAGLYNTDFARNAALEEQQIEFGANMRAQDYARNSQLAEANLNRGLEAQTRDLDRASQYWDTERNRQVGAYQNALAGGQYDVGMAKNLIGVGDIERQYQQDMLNSQLNQYNQWQQYPFQMADIFSSALARASGNWGQNTATTQQNYQANPYAALVGGGLLAAGMYGGMGG
jgi:hypothetical protein